MKIAAIPPMMPPAMAPVFELCPCPKLEGPIVCPGPSSLESTKERRGCETVTGREGGRGENSHHQWHTIGYSPNSFLSGTCCKYAIEYESLATNCDVEECPPGDTCSRRDRIGEPVGHRQCQTQQILRHNRSSLGGRHGF